jgi:hypothetical protein
MIGECNSSCLSGRQNWVLRYPLIFYRGVSNGAIAGVGSGIPATGAGQGIDIIFSSSFIGECGIVMLWMEFLWR